MIELVLLLTLGCMLGAVVGVLVVRRVLQAVARPAPPGTEAGVSRLRATLHAGSEQVLIGLARELRLPHGTDVVENGAPYLDSSTSRGCRSDRTR